MQFLCLFANTLTLFAHATALVIQIDIRKTVSDLNHDNDIAHLIHESEHVLPETSAIVNSCGDDSLQHFMSPQQGGDDVFIQDVMCNGPPGNPPPAPRKYTNDRIFATMDIGYRSVGRPINNYPHIYNPPLFADLNPLCYQANTVAVWTFPIFNPGAPNPGPDRVFFATSRMNVNAPAILCGVVAHTNAIGQPSMFQVCNPI